MIVLANPREMDVLRKGLELLIDCARDQLQYETAERAKMKPTGWDEVNQRVAECQEELDELLRIMEGLVKKQNPRPEPPQLTCPQPMPAVDAPAVPPDLPAAQVSKEYAALVKKYEPLETPERITLSEGSSKPPPTDLPIVDTGNNHDATPLSEVAIAIGRTLPAPFTSTDLKARLDGDSDRRAYNWIAAWKRKGWIDTVSFGNYRVSYSFGV